MRRDGARSVRVGLVVLLALGALLAAILLIGGQNNLFRSKHRYIIHLSNVTGLATGNPVQLNGVRVGLVESIVLPEDPDENQLAVKISIDERYARRVRQDSRAKIKTLGLLGDKYIEISSGTADAVVVPNGGEIEAAAATDVDELISSGEEVFENVVRISTSLVAVLERLEKGEGVVGELVTGAQPEGRSINRTIFATLDSVERLSDSLSESLGPDGRGPLARMLHDEALGDRLAGSVDRFEAVMTEVQEGDGLVPRLLSDAQLTEEVSLALADLRASSARLAEVTRQLEEGGGLLPRLLHDEEYGREVTDELRQLLEKLNVTVDKVTTGDGTLARLIEDPEVYQALNDVIVGINESKLLRWLIRNRQKAGIKKRYREERQPETRYQEDTGSNEPPTDEPSSS